MSQSVGSSFASDFPSEWLPVIMESCNHVSKAGWKAKGASEVATRRTFCIVCIAAHAARREFGDYMADALPTYRLDSRLPWLGTLTWM